MARVVLRDLTKRYAGDVLAVNKVNMDIADGEFVCFVGPSGCGKTTALRMISGLESISEGEVEIGDRIVNDLPARDRDIALVFQSYALYPHMSVYKNMSFGLELRKVKKPEIDKAVHEAARILDLEPYLDRKPGQLSGGQRQRVALGRAIVRDPAAFLMDEPLSNLDAKLRVQTRAEIARLHTRLGATMIYVTHDQIEAMTMADRIAVLNLGQLEQMGSPRELYDTPNNLFVAGFIGSPSMNFMDLAVANGSLENGHTRLVGAGIEVVLDNRHATEIRSAGLETVTVGVRPEHLSVGGSGSLSINAKIDVTEFLGNGILVHAQAEGRDIVATLESETAPDVGQNVVLTAEAEKVHLFDPQSGHSLRPGAP